MCVVSWGGCVAGWVIVVVRWVAEWVDGGVRIFLRLLCSSVADVAAYQWYFGKMVGETVRCKSHILVDNNQHKTYNCIICSLHEDWVLPRLIHSVRNATCTSFHIALGRGHPIAVAGAVSVVALHGHVHLMFLCYATPLSYRASYLPYYLLESTNTCCAIFLRYNVIRCSQTATAATPSLPTREACATTSALETRPRRAGAWPA